MIDFRTDAALVLAVAFVLSFVYEAYRVTAKAGVSRHDTPRGFMQQLPLYAAAAAVIGLLLLGPAWSVWVGLVFSVAMIAVSTLYYNPRIMLERRPDLVYWVEDLVFTGLLFVAAAQLWYAIRG
jgi:hypothetical protein